MKLAMPVEAKDMEKKVSPSFGRTPYFLIYDTDSKEAIYLDNGAAGTQGGAGIKAAQIIVDSNVQALLTPRCGKNAAEVLVDGGIKLYKTREGSVKENLEDFASDKLKLLEEIHEGFHNHGGK